LKLNQEEAYNLSAVDTTTEAVTPSEAVTQPSVSVVRPAKKTNQNGKRSRKAVATEKTRKRKRNTPAVVFCDMSRISLN